VEVARRLQQAGPGEFFAPFHLLAELFEHKERIVALTALSSADIVAAFHHLAESITFIREAAIPLGTWVEAHRLCREVDPDDTPYIALALHLDAELWTDDAALKAGLTSKGFTRFLAP
jgi:predicted nucleic acid-binding protein